MKRINEYKKLFSVEQDIDLAAIKKVYRNLVKEWHPDKFQADDEKAIEAEEKSRQIIDAYHFLVSIAPETINAGKAEYDENTASGIADYIHKGLLLKITFINGSCYEYFGVNGNMFQKFLNADKQFRFAKRNIFNSYLYRKAKKEVLAA